MKITKLILNTSLLLLALVPSLQSRSKTKTINLLQDAITSIQKTVNTENPYKIHRIYELNGNKINTVTEKVYFREYRKKSLFKKICFNKNGSNNKETRTIKFVFNSNNKNQLSLISTTNNKTKKYNKIKCSI